MISQKGYQALQAHSESYIRHAGLGRDGLPAVWMCVLFLLLIEGLQRPMAEEMGALFPQRAARLECGMLLLWPLFSWVSVARRRERGSRRRSGYQMSQMRSSSSSSASFVEEILVKKLGTWSTMAHPVLLLSRRGKVDGRDGE